MQTFRNVSIIALLALAVTVVPGGGAAAETVLIAITMAFFAAIAFMLARLYRDQEMTLMTMTDGRRALLFSAVGVIALLVVGFEEFRGFSGGVALWIMLMAAAVATIFFVWRDATTY